MAANLVALRDAREKIIARLTDHFAKDDLVAWAWNPGAGRAPAPGTQQQLGELIKAWIDTGAQCP